MPRRSGPGQPAGLALGIYLGRYGGCRRGCDGGASREPELNIDRRLAWLARVFLALLIFAVLFRAIGWSGFADALSGVRWRWLAALYAAVAAAVLVNASLLRYLLTSTGLEVSLLRVFLAKALSAFYSLLLPGDLFAGVAKWADLSAATGDTARVLSCLLAMKVALAMPPVVIGSLALLVSSPLPGPGLTIAASVMAVTLVTALVLALHPVPGKYIDRLLAAVLRLAPEFVRSRAAVVLDGISRLRTLPALSYVVVSALALGVFSLAILSMWCAATAASVDVPLSAFFWINLILFLSRLLPITVGNLGVREGILVLAFGLYGVDPAASVLVGLLMFSSFLFSGLIGAAYQIAIANGWVKWRTRPVRS